MFVWVDLACDGGTDCNTGILFFPKCFHVRASVCSGAFVLLCGVVPFCTLSQNLQILPSGLFSFCCS